MRPRLGQQAADGFETIGATVQSRTGLVGGYGPQQLLPLGPTDIGQVGDDEVHRLRQGRKQVSLEQMDAPFEPVAAAVESCHLQSRGRGVEGVDYRLGQVRGQADGYGPTARPHIGNGQRVGSGPANLKPFLHQQFRLWPGNQHPPIHIEIEPVKLLVADDVSHGLVLSASLDQFTVSVQFNGVQSPVGVSVDLGSGQPQDVTHQHLGVQAGSVKALFL